MKKFNNYTDKNSIDLFIKGIEKDIESKNYISALHLALSIPDMLSRIVYPKLGQSTRYAKWFDENVKDSIFGILYSQKFFDMDGHLDINGNICYAIRCKLFHEGTNDLTEKTKINEFVLSFTDEDYVRGKYAGKDYEFDKWNPNTGEIQEVNYLYISCRGLCNDIVLAAKEFISKNPDLPYPKLRINNGGGRIERAWFIN